MKRGWPLLVILWASACLVVNPKYVPEDSDGGGARDLAQNQGSADMAQSLGDMAQSLDDMAQAPPDMVPPLELLVPRGNYAIGGASFTVEAFYLDVHEITVGEYRTCVGSVGNVKCQVPTNNSSYCNWSTSPGAKENHPINCIKWSQAVEYCKFVGKRLPTEAEWEYAAAGAAKSKYPWGSSAPVKGGGQQLCWDQSSVGTCAVGSYPKTFQGMAPANPGFVDLAGNVWEWTDSQYSSTYTHPARTCTDECSLRGGSWQYDNPDYFRAADRTGSANPSYMSDRGGARCARTP